MEPYAKNNGAVPAVTHISELDIQNLEELEILYDFIQLANQSLFWIYMTLQTIYYDAPNKDEVIERLRQLPEDNYVVFSKYYQFERNDELRKLLDQFYSDMITYLETIANSDVAGIDAANKKFNAQVAQFSQDFSKFSPAWNPQYWTEMLTELSNLLADQMKSVVNSGYWNYSYNEQLLDRLSNEIGIYIAVGVIRDVRMRDTEQGPGMPGSPNPSMPRSQQPVPRNPNPPMPNPSAKRVLAQDEDEISYG